MGFKLAPGADLPDTGASLRRDFGRKMPSCNSEAFFDHFFGLFPYELVEKCLSTTAQHFSTIFLAIPRDKWS